MALNCLQHIIIHLAHCIVGVTKTRPIEALCHLEYVHQLSLIGNESISPTLDTKSDASYSI